MLIVSITVDVIVNEETKTFQCCSRFPHLICLVRDSKTLVDQRSTVRR